MPPAFIFSSPSLKSQTNLRPSKSSAQPRYRLHLSMAVPASEKRRGILMVCLGNICRSPAAEAVMNGVIARRNLQDQFFVDSCGTGGGSPNWYMEDGFSHHEGDPADPRMQAAAANRGLKLTSRSRPLVKQDFENFDVIVAMDHSNIDSIEEARQHWGAPQETNAKVVLMSKFSPNEAFRGRAVPDPYYSGSKGFEYALDLIEGACEGLADDLVNHQPQ